MGHWGRMGRRGHGTAGGMRHAAHFFGFSGWFGGRKDKAETAPAVVEQKAAPVVQAKDAATIADEEKQAETLAEELKTVSDKLAVIDATGDNSVTSLIKTARNILRNANRI